jgi:hypothetical protein
LSAGGSAVGELLDDQIEKLDLRAGRKHSGDLLQEIVLCFGEVNHRGASTDPGREFGSEILVRTAK